MPFRQEIEQYKPELLDKPAMLVVNKMDSPTAGRSWSELRQLLADGEAARRLLPDHCRPQRAVNFSSVVPISAKTDVSSVEVLQRKLRGCLDAHEAPPPDLEETRRRIRTGAAVALEGRVISMERGRRPRPPPPPQVPQLT